MERTIDILFVIGIVVNLIKGADLILRPHQQKWLQHKWESMTLCLDYTRPLTWYVSRGAGKVFKILIVITIFLLVLFFISAREILSITGTSWPLGIAFVAFIFLLITILMTADFMATEEGKYEGVVEEGKDKIVRALSGDELAKRTWKTLTKWVLGGEDLLENLLRPFLSVIAAVVIAYLGYLSYIGISFMFEITFQVMAIYDVVGFLAFILFFIAMPAGLVVIRLYGLILFLGIVSVFVLISSLVLLATELILKFMRAVAWRIAEYNKGAFAAIILIITIALGITELYLKTKTQTPPVPPVVTQPQTSGQ